MLKINCECPRCKMAGWRYADGFATRDDPTFECRNCQYRGGQEFTLTHVALFLLIVGVAAIIGLGIAVLLLGGRG